ncbi:hypothetical protein C8F04DRAFT_1193590 [Mycena alexandri]|uniref:Uncharacterized protein n=1 Tax=Mycena alexandri TaxID=1745969 RepID=A0AAD6S943_9AGAR|nr:hypothetical protein C8F04DRAFT_1193590 [Mycena alexandri]
MKSTMKRRKKQGEGIEGGWDFNGEQDEDEEMFWEDDNSQVERGPENQHQMGRMLVRESASCGVVQGVLREQDGGARRCSCLRRKYRRVGVSLEYEASKWDARAVAVPKEALDPQEAEGQSHMRFVRRKWDKVWAALRLARGEKGSPTCSKGRRGDAGWRSEGLQAARIKGDVVEEDDEGWGGL